MVKYIDNYTLYEIIGSGEYGKVYRATNNFDKKEYAVKVIPIQKFREILKFEECTVNEINILSSIESNQHIIRYYDMLRTNNNFYFIYEFCNGGTLERLLIKEKKLGESKALLIFKQLLDAFQILKKYNIMHKDMKPENIFFHNGIIKLGDIGFYSYLCPAHPETNFVFGSSIYLAPEVIRGEMNCVKADIWSLGVVLYEMVFGYCPFQPGSIAKLISLNSENLVFPSNISPALKSIISKMLTKDPLQRIGWMELFQIEINNQGFIQEPTPAINISSPNHVSIEEQNSSILNNRPKLFPNGSNVSNIEPTMESDTQGRSLQKNCNTVPVIDMKESVNGEMHRKFSEEHKSIIEGFQLMTDLMNSKVSNHMGFAYLILNKVGTQISEISTKTDSKELLMIFQNEMKDVKQLKENITNIMLPYEFKGLGDWKKYLRGKFFEEEETISLWYRMVCFLDGSKSKSNESYKAMTELIKSVLY